MTERIDIDSLARKCGLTVLENKHWNEPFIEGGMSKFTAYTRAVMEMCAQKCEAQKYMVLDPLRSYSAEDMCLGKKDTAKYLAAAIREMMP